MKSLTNSNKSINGGNVMNLVSFVLKTIEEGGCDVIHIQNYTLDEWVSLKHYIKEHHIRCALHNEEYVKDTYISISGRAIKQYFDIMFDRPCESWKAVIKEYNGDYEWDIEEEPFVKAHGNMVKKHGTIIHTSNKTYIK